MVHVGLAHRILEEIKCEYVGELLSIKEFNDKHDSKKLAKKTTERFTKELLNPHGQI